jgi:hypothetical protein
VTPRGVPRVPIPPGTTQPQRAPSELGGDEVAPFPPDGASTAAALVPESPTSRSQSQLAWGAKPHDSIVDPSGLFAVRRTCPSATVATT